MKKLLATFALTFSLAATTMFAQWSSASNRFVIPFDFTVGKTTIPAGTYDVKADAQSPVVLVQGVKNTDALYTMTQASSAKPADGIPTLVFRQIDGEYHLAKILKSGNSRELFSSKGEPGSAKTMLIKAIK